MAPHNTEPRETSPLLPKSDAIAEPVEAGNGIGPSAASAQIEAEQDGGDIERQTSNGDSSKHQGLPEVRKRMKYIFPAIAIGVRLSSVIHVNWLIREYSGVSNSCRHYPCRLNLWHHRHRLARSLFYFMGRDKLFSYFVRPAASVR
jgi:hypothetical protein